MKKITYMLLAGALLCSCADEKPHFLPAPGGTVEIGGIGATPSSDAAALLDDDLTTYFEAEVGSENSVEAVVDCSAGRIVAYTLVSSGVVEQGDNGVEALYDPVTAVRRSRSSPVSRNISITWRRRPTMPNINSCSRPTAATS